MPFWRVASPGRVALSIDGEHYANFRALWLKEIEKLARKQGVLRKAPPTPLAR
jgi:hypothetical protein